MATPARPDLFAYVGCRTTKERQGKGDGISVFHVEGATGRWTEIQQLKGIVNPSFLAFDRRGQYLYTVHADIGGVSAYAINATSGMLKPLNTAPSGGRNPVHLAPDPTNRFLVVANYASSNVAAMPIQADGTIGPPADVLTLTGTLGPHKTQQIALYPHHCPFDPTGRFVIVPDKGGDQICVLRLDASTGKLAMNGPAIPARSGAAPRHIAVHPERPFAYLANELDSTIATYRWDSAAGTLAPLQILPSLPASYTGNNTTAGIAVGATGRHVYISNRGHDSIAIFAIDDRTGLLEPVGWQPTQGRQPRFFTIDPSGTMLYAANELGDTIVAFRIDAATGQLTPTGLVVPTLTPTCIVFKAA